RVLVDTGAVFGGWVQPSLMDEPLLPTLKNFCKTNLDESVSNVLGSPVEVEGAGSSFSDCETTDL
ncbi:hypothetical protein NL387_26830, partial [Klebsiella pneumoniae]|nr:hypothetical protein [Klebsiella pneumoniae]